MNEQATRFPELNVLLHEFVDRVAAATARNFVGAYLVGSFALGDADEHSDVDFLVVTDTALTADQEATLRAMHAELPGRELIWARHLEGSYAPRAELVELQVAPSEWLFVDNGATTMELSTHCNTALERWVLRQSRNRPCGSTAQDSLTSDLSR